MEFLQEWGYIGLFLGTFMAATVILFSSDFLLIGILLAGGDPLTSFLTATAGNWLGGLSSYGLGWLGKWEWIEKWLSVSKEKLHKQKTIIDKYGPLIALLSWAPFIGDIFSIGLGFYKVNFPKCALYMLIGKALRFAFWIILFYFFEDKLLLF